MRFIPKCYYHKDIIKLVNDHVSEGYETYSSLSEHDKEKITAECIKILGNDAYNCIIESDDFDQVLHHLRRYLITGEREYAHDLAETMAKNATEYFTNVMNDLFSERFNEWEYAIKIEAGLHPVIDKTNGETRWL